MESKSQKLQFLLPFVSHTRSLPELYQCAHTPGELFWLNTVQLCLPSAMLRLFILMLSFSATHWSPVCNIPQLKIKISVRNKMFLVSGSVTSLVAGLVSGLLAAVGAYLASQNPKNVWVSLGEQVYVRLWKCNNRFCCCCFFNARHGDNWSSPDLGTSGTLTVVMGLRFINTGKFMPAGLMTLLR